MHWALWLIVPQTIIRIILRDPRNANTSRDIPWTRCIVGSTSFGLIGNCQCEVVVYKCSPQRRHASKVWLQTTYLRSLRCSRTPCCWLFSSFWRQWWLCSGSESWSKSVLREGGRKRANAIPAEPFVLRYGKIILTKIFHWFHYPGQGVQEKRGTEEGS